MALGRALGVLILSLVLLSGTSRAASLPTESKSLTACGHKAQWTVIYYSNGDNDLQRDLVNDLHEAAVVGSSALPKGPPKAGAPVRLHLLMLLDTQDIFRGGTYSIRIDKATDARWYDRLRLEEWAGVVAQRPEANMADGATLKDYLAETLACYPADRIALIINGHGSGARAGPGARTNSRSRAFSVDRTLPGASADPLEKPPEEDVLYVAEAVGAIKAALSTVKRTRFDLIGLDACLMSTIEVGFAFQDVARVLVASENLEGPSGWSHDLWLNKLAGDPLAEPATVAGYITKTYRAGILTLPKDSVQSGLLSNRTLAVMALDPKAAKCAHDGPEGLAAKLDDLGATILDNPDPALRKQLFEARRKCRSFGPNSHPDDANADLTCVIAGFGENLRRLAEANPAQAFPQVVTRTNLILKTIGCMMRDSDVGDLPPTDPSEIPEPKTKKPFGGLGVFLPKNQGDARVTTIWQDLLQPNRDAKPLHPVLFFESATGWTRLLGDHLLK